ncbi:PREDICTED: putative disease resistance RPP13-like protein 1 [Theobroma cacao]|uniref:Disease resistance RPP13-like protein 1 n=1 Tax=Theobroma cacao TaxID=3641 RepID=A0AB32W3Q6_THECC|nr:PREDICTED: putative disease resistance RPP13-like protein 1 [Theobroma cacao]
MGSLTNLRHLDTRETCLEKMPLRLGRLTNLQMVSNFVVRTGNSPGMTEIENLSNLRGTLSISGLHNVTNIKDAIQAKLKTKKNLDEFVLEWSYNSNDSRYETVETEVFDVLEARESLQKLTIKYYGGKEFPSRLGDSSFTNMVCLHLYGCKKFTLLPSLRQLLSLRDLSITGMNGISMGGLSFYGVLILQSSLFHCWRF